MGFRQTLIAWKSTLVRDSQPIWGVVPKDLHPSQNRKEVLKNIARVKESRDLMAGLPKGTGNERMVDSWWILKGNEE
jgi:hypothetical protein